jgi:hypothetical protein
MTSQQLANDPRPELGFLLEGDLVIIVRTALLHSL